jgi:hypothetical protein
VAVAAWSVPDFDRYRHRRSSDPTATCATVRRREAYVPSDSEPQRDSARALAMVSPLLSTVSESSRQGAMDRCMNSTSPTPTGCPPESRPSVCVRADIGIERCKGTDNRVSQRL